jgi:hypothetical protein
VGTVTSFMKKSLSSTIKKRKKEKNFDYLHGNKVWQSLIGTVKGHYLTEHINC